MNVGFALVGLMVLDGAFAGFRAVMGRTGRVRLGPIAVRSALLGAGFAAILGGCFLQAMAMAGGPSAALVTIGEQLVGVYSVYAALIAVGFALRAIPNVDVRTLTSVLIFGPLTLLRPFVIVGGAAWAALAAPEPAAVGVTALGVICVFFVEQCCEHWLWRGVLHAQVP
ncbi:MAG: hypothetical protein H6737_07260 [Alphaproteobacteria bacterium]|nr:hypothetical protein [Alphaproteobacteria bacterium]